MVIIDTIIIHVCISVYMSVFMLSPDSDSVTRSRKSQYISVYMSVFTLSPDSDSVTGSRKSQHISVFTLSPEPDSVTGSRKSQSTLATNGSTATNRFLS